MSETTKRRTSLNDATLADHVAGIEHVGLWPGRTVGDFTQARRERALAEAWERENRDRPTLAMLLARQIGNPLCVAMPEWEITYDPTQRDAHVAATVLQWLGSNVGFCMLERALADAGYRIIATTPPAAPPE
jgi:hypothetical protein